MLISTNTLIGPDFASHFFNSERYNIRNGHTTMNTLFLRPEVQSYAHPLNINLTINN